MRKKVRIATDLFFFRKKTYFSYRSKEIDFDPHDDSMLDDGNANLQSNERARQSALLVLQRREQAAIQLCS